MSIKLDTLSDWRPLTGSIGLLGASDETRRVKLYLNCEAQTAFYYKPGVEAPRFLTTVPAGLSTVEFWAAGNVEIAPADADAIVQWQTTEHEVMVIEGDGETFTTIHERAPRNEALEWVMYQQELNQKRMQAALRDEMQAELAAMREHYERQSGIHVGAAAQHQESEGVAGGKSGRKAPARPGRPAGRPDVDDAGKVPADAGADHAKAGSDQTPPEAVE